MNVTFTLLEWYAA